MKKTVGDKFINEVLNGGYNVHPVPLPNSKIIERIMKVNSCPNISSKPTKYKITRHTHTHYNNKISIYDHKIETSLMGKDWQSWENHLAELNLRP